jgi:hypothetical protein
MAPTTVTESEKRGGAPSLTIYKIEETLNTEPEARDYSGAHEKTDPREIALVKKLDWWIMPILWLMYWLNYLVCAQDRRLAMGGAVLI